MMGNMVFRTSTTAMNLTVHILHPGIDYEIYKNMHFMPWLRSAVDKKTVGRKCRESERGP